MRIYKKIDGNKISCIKEVKDVFGLTLRDSKNIIDEMQATNKPVNLGDHGLTPNILSNYEMRLLREYGFCISEDYEIKMDDDLFKI